MPAEAASAEQVKPRVSRIIDMFQEPLKMLPPLGGYPHAATVTLENAIQPLLPSLPALICYANNAKDQCPKPPPDGLTVDESAAIMLYTTSWKPLNKCLHHALNAVLRSEDRTKLEPWFLYLKLFFSALERLPSLHQTVYRGIKQDMEKDYKEGETIIWWGVSSCTASVDLIQSEVFAETAEARTIFEIECDSAKDIHKHSLRPAENEILILPAIQFEVVTCLKQDKSVLKIKLQETTPSSPLRQPVTVSIINKSSSGKNRTGTQSQNGHDVKERKDSSSILIWLDSGKAHEGEGYHNTMTRLQQFMETIYPITDSDECIKMIKKNSSKTIFMIIAGSIGQELIPNIHDLPQIDTIFVFCGSKARHEKWAKAYLKINGLYTDIKDLCNAVKKVIEEQSTLIRSTGPNGKMTKQRLDRSFIYIQILKEIILQIRFSDRDIKDFIAYCRQQFAGNDQNLKICDQLEQEYRKHTPIWWCTCECFLYSMLNRALSTMDINLIIKMGFFIQHLHRQIEQLHSEQFHHKEQSSVFNVYRGQGLSKTDFDQLSKTKGGLLSFNNFSSTSKHQETALNFARQAINNPDLVGIFFCIKIDPSILPTLYASIDNIAFSDTDGEILFTIPSIFRIDDIKQIDENDRLWQIELTLTNHNDPQLHLITKYMQKETEGQTAWHRLGKLLLKLGVFDKAEEIFNMLLSETNDNRDKTILFNQLALVKCGIEEYGEAIYFFEKAYEIYEKTLPPEHLDLAESCINIGSAYEKMNEYSTANSFYEKAIQIGQRSLPASHPTIRQWRKMLKDVPKEK